VGQVWWDVEVEVKGLFIEHRFDVTIFDSESEVKECNGVSRLVYFPGQFDIVQFAFEVGEG